MNELFFELIHVALGQRQQLSYIPSEKEWEGLYTMAKQQTLLGVCFFGVQELRKSAGRESTAIGMTQTLYLQWMGTAAIIQQRNELINRRCVEIQRMVEEAGFSAYIMKGQGNAVHYGAMALLRQPGDIDIYLDGGFDKVMEFVNATHPTKAVNELELHYPCFADTEVEIHYRPFIMRNPFKNRVLQRFFKKEGEKCFKNKLALPNSSDEISVPTSVFNLVHQMVHIYHHLLIGGVGLRQLMDYYFVLRDAHEKNVDCHEAVECIHQLGLNRFASALMWVLGNAFGLQQKYMLWEPHKKNGEFLQNEVILSGNFGNCDQRLPQHRSKWQSFWMLSLHNLRLFRFTYDDWFWGPLWRLYHYFWKQKHGFK